jgi:hypothetical protein
MQSRTRILFVCDKVAETGTHINQCSHPLFTGFTAAIPISQYAEITGWSAVDSKV